MRQANDPMNIQPMKRIQHRNFVNRFVTPFKAQPYGLFESYFLIGSNGQPRAVGTQKISININIFIDLDNYSR
jgi:hypothetical protein